MAYANISSNSYTRIYASIGGLQYADSEYWFLFELQYLNNGTWTHDNWEGWNDSVNYAEFVTDPGYTYRVICSAYYKGNSTQYDFTSGSVYLSPIPTPTISGQSSTITSITFTTSLTAGNRSTYFYASFDNATFDWKNINDINNSWIYYLDGTYAYFNFTTNGNQITFNGLHPSTQYGGNNHASSYYFLVYAVLDGYSSTSASNNGNTWLTYNTSQLNAPDFWLDSKTATSLKLYRYSSQSSYLTTWIWNGSLWVTIQNSGYSYSTNGNYLTISGLSNYTTYFFYEEVFGAYNGNTIGVGSITPNNGTGYYSFTTSDIAPTISSITFSNYSTTGFRVNVNHGGGHASLLDINWQVYNGYSWTSFSSSTFDPSVSGFYYDITGLSVNTRYQVRVQLTGDGSSGWYQDNTYTNNYPQLGQPTLSSSSVTSKSITFAMNSVSNATWYDCSLYLNGVWQNNFAGSSARSGTFDNLTYNTGYVLHLTVSASNYSDNTNDISKTTSNLSTPSAPTNISFTQSQQTQYVNASWTNGANTNRMDIDMSSDGVNWGSIDWPTQQNQSYTLDTGYYGQHYFRLRPHNYDGYNDVVGSWTTAYGVVFIQGNVYAWNGSSWVLAEVYTWNGSSWVKNTETAKSWNGSSWI